MRKNWLFLIFATILVLFHHDSNAQKKKIEEYKKDPKRGASFDKKMKYADDLFIDGSFFNAIDYYQQLKAGDERNPYITNQLADCYRYTRDYVLAAHYYVEVARLSKKTYPYATYYAGLMLKQQGEYQAAIAMFNEFLADNKKSAQKPVPRNQNEVEPRRKSSDIDQDPDRTVDPKAMKDVKKRAKMEIEGCTMAIASIKDPKPVTIINAGPNVNTVRTELSPYPLGDSSLLFSTSGRNMGNAKRNDVKFNADEDHDMEQFFISHKQTGYVDSFQWPMEFRDGNFNNPKEHTANGSYSAGGDYFYYSRCHEDPKGHDTMKEYCKIYYSHFGVAGWGPSYEVPGGVNDGKSNNTMPCVGKVGKKEVLFFASDRKTQSRGGYDIWYSVIDPRNHTYRRPQNCGKQVNTTSDEITPYYDSKTQKFYWASNGKKSFGGFDIYSGEGGPSRYKKVENMGYPINTSADELYYINDPMGKPDAWVVSNRIGSFALKNPTCCNDIWRIQQEPKLAVIGKVLDKRTQQLMPQTVVKMVDQKGDMNTYNSEDGNFLFNMSRGHSYVITGDKQGYTSSRASVSTMEIKRSDPDDTVLVTIFLDTIRNSFSVSNIYYDYDKATLRPESVASLDSVVNFLHDNPSITVEIYSYTDSKGTPEYNLALSQRRAQSVLDYLEKNTIDRGRMTAKGFGPKNAAAPNEVAGKDNPEGRQLNRRTEFRIISDLPTRRVLYNSAMPGTMDQQERNLHVEDESTDDEPVAPGAKKPAADKDEDN